MSIVWIIPWLRYHHAALSIAILTGILLNISGFALLGVAGTLKAKS